MKERPILMNAFSVGAILAGKKTQTRRVLKTQPLAPITKAELWLDGFWRMEHRKVKRKDDLGCYTGLRIRCPYGVPGDRLWVRETFMLEHGGGPDQRVIYRATNPEYGQHFKWTPSIFMPRWASRITLEVMGVRVERVQDISEEDAQSEGCTLPGGYENLMQTMFAEPHREVFRDLWNEINAKRGYGWDVNPWVWVVEFSRCE